MNFTKEKDKILEKITKKNRKNELEEILEKKDYAEDVKNLLLSMLYKIEAAYKDYETVKRNVETKDEYLEKLINIIKEKCKTIKFVKPNSKEAEKIGNRTFIVDKENNEIICYPIERKLLYTIWKMDKEDEIVKEKYPFITKSLTTLINVGNNINNVEVIRNFNGWSWSDFPKEIENLEYNLIYQNIRILLGSSFLNEWIENKEYIIDYTELALSRLEEKYNYETVHNFFKYLSKLAILIDIKLDEKIRQEFQEEKRKLTETFNQFENKVEYVEILTKKKKEKTRELKEIDKILSNKELMKQEYIKRNEKLENSQKIFSIRVLTQIIQKEREEILENIEEMTNLLQPKQYVEKKKEIENNLLIVKDLDIEKDFEKQIEENMLMLQKVFLEIFSEKIKKVETKKQIINLLYNFRYYSLIPINDDEKIKDVSNLKKDYEKTEEQLINKMIELKITNQVSTNEKINFEILKNIFSSRVIKLEEIYIKIAKEKEKIIVTFFDENILEENSEILMTKEQIKNSGIKFNKKMKVIN